MLGLRGTGTGTLRLTRVPVCGPDLLGPVGSGYDLMTANHRTPLNPGLLALGIASAAVEAALAIYAGRVEGVPSRTNSEAARRTIVEAVVLLEASYTYAGEVICRMDASPDQAYFMSSRLKLQATLAAERVTRHLMQGAGSRGFLSSFPLERHFRDAQATSLMGPTTDLCLDRLATDIFIDRDATRGVER